MNLEKRVQSRVGETPLLIDQERSFYRADVVGRRPVSKTMKRVALCLTESAELITALAALDGSVDAILLLSPMLEKEKVEALVREAQCDMLISDRMDIAHSTALKDAVKPGVDRRDRQTDWIVTTSGTTGTPKMVAHRLVDLARTVRVGRGEGDFPVWGLTYEPTRFAGLQVVLQAVLGNGILVAPRLDADSSEKLELFLSNEVTHLSATPTLWRLMLMHPVMGDMPLRQLTLGGEIADQRVLDALRSRFPQARITHIYASTETGVGFSVHDGHEGFPVEYLQEKPAGVDLKIVDGCLWVRVEGSGADYLGQKKLERDSEGYVNTRDAVRQVGQRVYFLGRDTGAVNVGGTKVHPEETENVLNEMPEILLARVSVKKNPLSGSILIADVIPRSQPDDATALKSRIARFCRERLRKEAVPALIRFPASLDVNAAGKLTRSM